MNSLNSVIDNINRETVVPMIGQELNANHIQGWYMRVSMLRDKINKVITTKSRYERVKNSLSDYSQKEILNLIEQKGEYYDSSETQHFLIETYELFAEIGQYLRQQPILYEISTINKDDGKIVKYESITLTHAQLFQLNKDGNYMNFIAGSSNLKSFSSLVQGNNATIVEGDLKRINKLRASIGEGYNLGVIGEAEGQFRAMGRKRLTKKAISESLYAATRNLAYWKGPDYIIKQGEELVAIQKKVNSAHLTTLNSCIRQLNFLNGFLASLKGKEAQAANAINQRLNSTGAKLDNGIDTTVNELINELFNEFNA